MGDVGNMLTGAEIDEFMEVRQDTRPGRNDALIGVLLAYCMLQRTRLAKGSLAVGS